MQISKDLIVVMESSLQNPKNQRVIKHFQTKGYKVIVKLTNPN
jgi:predicted ABC-type ATPase